MDSGSWFWSELSGHSSGMMPSTTQQKMGVYVYIFRPVAFCVVHDIEVWVLHLMSISLPNHLPNIPPLNPFSSITVDIKLQCVSPCLTPRSHFWGTALLGRVSQLKSFAFRLLWTWKHFRSLSQIVGSFCWISHQEHLDSLKWFLFHL